MTERSLAIGPVCEMSPIQLAARCQQIQSDASHEPFCLALFRRAIVERCTLCWYYIYNQYYSLVRYWVAQRAPSDPNTIDDLTQDAFTAFWRFYTPDKLSCARGLGDVLSYLKSCAATAVTQAYRKVKGMVLEAELDEQVMSGQVCTGSIEALALQKMETQQLWAIVEATCGDEREHLVARLILQANLKPGDLARQFPDLFPTVAEVYRVKRNLLDRLRRDSSLREMYENE